MRYLFSIVSLFFLVSSSLAQNLTPTFRFAAEVDEELQQQFTTLLYREGCTVDTLSGVIISLRMSPMQEGVIDGMRRLHTASFQLYIESRISGSERVLTAEVAQVQSTGTTPEQAQRSALQQLNSSSSRMSPVIKKMMADYEKMFSGPCHALLAEAASLANKENYLAALALADAVPADADCYNFAQGRRTRFYEQYQEAFCNEHLTAARNSLAVQQPKAALDELAKIDPQSNCAAEAQQLLAEASTQLQDQQSAKARFLRQVYQNQVQVEQARNQIISDLVRE